VRPLAYAFAFFSAASCLLLSGCKKGDPAPADPIPAASPGSATSPAKQVAAGPREGLVREGEQAPDFSVRAHDGQEVSLSKLRGRAVVLYFYPKDGTPGCTVEAQQFTASHADLEAAGAVILGVSSDDNDSHAEFAEEHGLPFRLLPDEGHALARTYGVKTTFGMTQRVTFLIDRAGVVARVYEDVTPKKHAAEILAELQRMNATVPTSAP
jgi:peroxiredoxin Q/BCP